MLDSSAHRFPPIGIGISTLPRICPFWIGSTAPRMRSPVVELLADLVAALDVARAPWFLFGAQAAILHGAARLTADVDVTVRLPDAMSNQALAQALERCRFQRRVVDPTFIERTRIIPVVHLPTKLR